MDAQTRELYAAIGRGETVQVKQKGCNVQWYDHDPQAFPLGHADFEWRIKPRTRTVTLELPEPMRVAPEVGTTYWLADPLHQSPSEQIWVNDLLDQDWLSNGLCYSTQAAAEAVRSAIRKALGAA